MDVSGQDVMTHDRCPTVSLAIAVLVLAVSASPLASRSGRVRLVQPASYSSLSGAYVLEVDPSTRQGAGPGSYRLLRDGELVWEGERPFTLVDAVVGDDGMTAGYAYTQGLEGQGELVFALLAPDGSLRGEWREAQVRSRYLHSDPTPRALDVVSLPVADVAILRVADLDRTRQRQSWWRIRLSDGERLDTLANPMSTLSDSGGGPRSVTAVAVPGTPLVLCHWWVYVDVNSWGKLSSWLGVDSAQGPGGLFSLHDPEGRVVWETAFLGDYARSDDDEAAALRTQIWATGAVLGVDEHRFDLWRTGDMARVRFEVSSQDGRWQVRELGVEPYTPVESERDQAPKPVATPFEAAVLGVVDFGAAGAAPPVSGVVCWNLDDKGRVGVVRQPAEEGGFSRFELIDNRGVAVRSFALPGIELTSSLYSTLSWVSGERWLLAADEVGESAPGFGCWIDAAGGSLENFANWNAPSPVAVERGRDGSFVLLGVQRSRYSQTSQLVAYDNTGRRRWSVGENYQDEAMLFSPEDVALASNGDIVVLEKTSNRLKVYGSNGGFLSSLDLTVILGQEPSYPTDLHALPDGGWLLYDFGARTMHRLDAAFALLDSFPLSYADGTRSDRLRLEHIGADGRWWGRDRSAFVVFGEDGVVESYVGAPPDPQRIEWVAYEGQFVDGSGNIYLLDDRTATVHAFDASGARRWVARLPAGASPSGVDVDGLAVRGDGQLFLWNWFDGERAEIDHQGRVVPPRTSLDTDGEVATDGEPTTIAEVVHWGQRRDRVRELAFVPGSSRHWVRVGETLELREAAGNLETRIERGPDRRWLCVDGALRAAKDGSVAFVDKQPKSDGVPPRVLVVDQEGGLRQSVPLPEVLAEHVGIAYDGRHVVVRGFEALLVVDMESGSRQLATLEENHGWAPYIAPGGDEIWLLGFSKPTLTRIAMP